MEIIEPSRPPFDFKEGALLLVNKPLDWTSFDVVNKLRFAIRRLYGQKKFKVGHAGTLDPKATGLLVICTGKWTKRLEELQGLPKTYTGSIRLGATTPSFDSETEIDQTYPTEHINAELLAKAQESLTGDIEQVPPMFSAIKVDGQPLYKKARKGQMVEVKPRPVHISRFELSEPTGVETESGGVALLDVDFAVDCSKGTYIRSLAYDLGKALGSGAYLTSLRRTAIGPYRIEDAWEVEHLVENINGLDRLHD